MGEAEERDKRSQQMNYQIKSLSRLLCVDCLYTDASYVNVMSSVTSSAMFIVVSLSLSCR